MKTKKQAGFELIAVIPKTKTDCTIYRELDSHETLEAASCAAKEKAFLPEISRIDIWHNYTLVGRIYSKNGGRYERQIAEVALPEPQAGRRRDVC